MIKRLINTAYIIFITGLLFLVLSAYIDVQYPKELYNFGVLGNMLIRNFTKDLGIALTISAIVNVIMEKSGFSKEYLTKISKVMTTDDFLNYLTREKLSEMKVKLEQRLFFNNHVYGLDNYYTAVQNEMISLLDNYYYDECYLRVECYVNHNHILKKTYRRMIIVNPIVRSQKNKQVNIPFITEMKCVEGYKDEDIFKINFLKVIIGNKTENIELKPDIKRVFNEYDKSYSIRFEATHPVVCEESCIVEMEIQSITPLTDISFSNTLTRPCKNYDIAFHLHDGNYKVEGYSFGFFENHSNAMIEYRCEQSMEIRFLDWTLPGNGVVFTINKK